MYGQTPRIIFAASVRPSVCHESQRRRHGVTAAIVVDVVAVRVRLSVRFKLHLRDGPTDGWTVRPSLRWSLTFHPPLAHTHTSTHSSPHSRWDSKPSHA